MLNHQSRFKLVPVPRCGIIDDSTSQQIPPVQ